jgi:RNA ligase (TIGR02306 family)
MRKLVTVRKISAIESIDGADKIEKVVVDGWNVVAQKGIHEVGKNILFFEIDSFLPESDPRFESFMKFGTRTFDGVKGHKVKTIRLKGVYSQGIIMPLSEFPEITDPQEDVDYAEVVGIVKWEAPAERGEGMGYQGDKKGEFPWFLRKSDQERIQNLYGKLSQTNYNTKFVGTLKMDGSSITVFYVEGEKYSNQGWGYCSRNQELKLPAGVKVSPCLVPDGEDNFIEREGKFFQGAYNSDLFRKCLQLHTKFGSYYAIQGELVGAGIQGNFEKFDTYQVFAYNIFDIEKQEFVDYNTFTQMAEAVDLQICPVVYEEQYILQESLEDILAMANGAGLKADYREGLVWKQVDGNLQFKVISNRYLEKQE